MTLTASPGGSNALRPAVSMDFGDENEKRKKKKRRSALGHFFPLSNVYVNGLALGGMK